MNPQLWLLLTLLLALLNGAASAGENARPNIIFILADDWGWGDLSCHGNKLVSTPNIDRLAREGREFYQFNVGSPVCSPSRVAFTTGQFPARFGIHEAIGPAAKNLEVGQVDWLDPQATTLPRLLKSAGYVTGHFGKWHLSGRFNDAPLPEAYGINEHAVMTAPAQANPTDHRKMFDSAIAFLRTHKNEHFYMNLWIHETHLVHLPTDESLTENSNRGEQQRIYSATVADGDKGIGKVLAALLELHLEQNTIVIFSSDNGPENTSRSPEKGEGYGGYYSVGSTGGLRGRSAAFTKGACGCRLLCGGQVTSLPESSIRPRCLLRWTFCRRFAPPSARSCLMATNQMARICCRRCSEILSSERLRYSGTGAARIRPGIAGRAGRCAMGTGSSSPTAKIGRNCIARPMIGPNNTTYRRSTRKNWLN